MSGSQGNSGYHSEPQRFASGPTAPPHLRVEINSLKGNTVTPSLPRNEQVQQHTTPHGFQRPTSALQYLPLSVYTLYDRFDHILDRTAPEWWNVLKEAKVRVGYSLLSGRIAPRICLTMDDALTAINETIRWFRLYMNDSEWNPIGPPKLEMDRYMLSFEISLDDATFRDFVYGKLTDTPTVFFARVRSSIQQLICTPPMNTLHSYPRCPILNPPQIVHDDLKSHLDSLVDWDKRWGYGHWHQLTPNTHGFTAQWFSDPGMCDIVSHTLRMESSAGSFAVFYPQDHAPPYDISANVPVTIETLSFVLAALVLELKLFAKKVHVPPGVHNAYIASFRIEKDRVYDILSRVWDRTWHTGDPRMEEDMRQGLELFLNSYATHAV